MHSIGQEHTHAKKCLLQRLPWVVDLEVGVKHVCHQRLCVPQQRGAIKAKDVDGSNGASIALIASDPDEVTGCGPDRPGHIGSRSGIWIVDGWG